MAICLLVINAFSTRVSSSREGLFVLETVGKIVSFDDCSPVVLQVHQISLILLCCVTVLLDG